MQHVLALRNVTLRCRLVELPATVRTLNVVAGVANRRWWKVTQSSTCCQMRLNLLRRANRIYELLVLASPICLYLWFLRFFARFLRSFYRERFQIRSLDSVHGRVELLSLLLDGLCADLFVKGDAILGKTASAHLTGDQIHSETIIRPVSSSEVFSTVIGITPSANHIARNEIPNMPSRDL